MPHLTTYLGLLYKNFLLKIPFVLLQLFVPATNSRDRYSKDSPIYR